MWFDLDPDDRDVIVMNTKVERLKYRQLQKDPRVSLLFEDGLEWYAMRGTVELEDNVVAAVNAALDDLAGKLRERRAESGVDPRLLKAKLDALRERNMARLESYLKALGDVVRGIGPA